MVQPELEHVACALCGQTIGESVAKRGQFGLPAHVVVCEVCGFSFLRPRWTKSRYDRFYSEEYDRYYRPEVLAQNDDHHKFEPARKIVARLKERGLLRVYGAVLDLGSGMGHALTYLRDRHDAKARYDAIEPSPTCRDHLVGEGFGHLTTDVYADWDSAAQGRYDLVIMRHVLEHFHDPLAVLKKVRAVLSEEGLLYVAVPDALHPTRPLRSHFFRVVHISYFSRNSLSAMLGLAGLEVMHITEGDAHERNEVFAICRRGPVLDFTPDPGAAGRQLAIYRSAGRFDLYYEFKGWAISLLRRLKLIRS